MVVEVRGAMAATLRAKPHRCCTQDRSHRGRRGAEQRNVPHKGHRCSPAPGKGERDDSRAVWLVDVSHWPAPTQFERGNGMRIGIEGKVLTPRIGGIGRYAVNLVEALLSLRAQADADLELVIFTARRQSRRFCRA